jgi:peptidoglycan/LPS O-acetylase OafA/YrhL
MSSVAATEPRSTPHRQRWLDGVRGGAALFVVFHHLWLATWPAFPVDQGPWWLGWLLYGHLAVAVFIVVSGYSLMLAPAKHGGRLVGGTRRFLRRRAWRILPAYWAALVISMIVFVVFTAPGTSAGTASKSFLVHATLLQDVVGNVAPNGTFWSIAVEWQIYFVFPLILLVALRSRMAFAVTATVGVVLIAHALTAVGPLDKINDLSPQFLALFALGAGACWAARHPLTGAARRALGAVAGGAFVAVVVLALVQGSPWMAGHFFWVDLLFGVAVAAGLLLASTTTGAWRERTLGSAPAVALGAFSYSLYLMHAPVLDLVHKYVIAPSGTTGVGAFALELAVALPAILVACYAFHRVFERPFLERRDLASLRTLPAYAWLVARVPALGGAAPVASPAPAAALADASSQGS